MKSLSARFSFVRLCCLLAASACCLATTSRAADQLIINGGFETGSFTGWTQVDQANPFDVNAADHFYLSTPGGPTPAVDGFYFDTAANPGGGSFYAVTASDNPGAHALLQTFTVPSATTELTLSFQMFVNDQSGVGAVIDPFGLDYTTGGTYDGNQHARVDILRAGADALSTSSSDVIANLYLGVDSPGGTPPNPYLDYSFDLSSLLTPGQSYQLRFAEVDNLSSLNLGVDNVRLFAVTPEPGLLALLIGTSVVGGLCLRRRRKASGCGEAACLMEAERRRRTAE